MTLVLEINKIFDATKDDKPHKPKTLELHKGDEINIGGGYGDTGRLEGVYHFIFQRDNIFVSKKHKHIGILGFPGEITDKHGTILVKSLSEILYQNNNSNEFHYSLTPDSDKYSSKNETTVLEKDFTLYFVLDKFSITLKESTSK